MRRLSDQIQLIKERRIDGGLRRNRALERAYRIAARNYVAQPYDGRVTLIRSEEFSSIERKNGHLGWGELARRGFDYFVVPGRHLDMFREPTVKFVAERLTECLNFVNVRAD